MADTVHPGPWLVARFAPASLFSLKASFATSSVGTTLVVPTPYALKMALVDAAFRAGESDDDCAALLRALIPVPVRIAPPDAVVTHTFTKIRQEPKKKTELEPYGSNIAYREMAFHRDDWHWAFGLEQDGPLAEKVAFLLPHIRYVGKRGGFVQYRHAEWQAALNSEFTQVVGPNIPLLIPPRCHIVPLDDFGPEASLEVLSSFSEQKARRDRHRRFAETVVPLVRGRSGAGFTEYRK